MARKTKYNDKLVADIVKLLEDGNTDTDTCALSGISTETFYTWIESKIDFSDAITHARGIARQRAVDAYRAAMKETSQKSAKTVVFTETRLDKNGKPYTYQRTTTEKAVTELAPDWRAAESYLKRRDPANWAETYIIKVKPEQSEVLKEAGLTAGDGWEQFIELVTRSVKNKLDARKMIEALINEMDSEPALMEKD